MYVAAGESASGLKPGPLPDISIIIAAYNAADTISAAVESALGQRGLEFEVVVVDDGSADGTAAAAQSSAVGRSEVRVVSVDHRGTGVAVNVGMRMARADLLVRLDADDRFVERYLETMADFMGEHPDYDIYSCDLLAVQDARPPERVFGWTIERSLTLSDMLDYCQIPGAGTIVRRAVLERTGEYREGIHNEDYDFWLRALAAGCRHIYCPEALYMHARGGEGQKSANVLASLRSDMEIIQNLVDNVSLSPSDLAKAKESMLRIATEQMREEEAQWLVTLLARVLPRRRVDGAARCIRRIGRIARPLRGAARLVRAKLRLRT